MRCDDISHNRHIIVVDITFRTLAWCRHCHIRRRGSRRGLHVLQRQRTHDWQPPRWYVSCMAASTIMMMFNLVIAIIATQSKHLILPHTGNPEFALAYASLVPDTQRMVCDNKDCDEMLTSFKHYIEVFIYRCTNPTLSHMHPPWTWFGRILLLVVGHKVSIARCRAFTTWQRRSGTCPTSQITLESSATSSATTQVRQRFLCQKHV